MALCHDVLGIEVGDIVLIEDANSYVRVKVEGMNIYKSEDHVMFAVWGIRFGKDGELGKRNHYFNVMVKGDNN